MNNRYHMLVVSLSGMKVHVSFSKACADWTVATDFKGKVSSPSELDTYLPEVRRLRK